VSNSLEQRAAERFSGLYLTLVSVLVGLVLSDLFDSIHTRMTLMPLTWETGRTWGQIFSNSTAVLSSWVTYSHLGMLRNRVPTIWDTVDALLVLVTVPLNAATGLHDSAAWFFWAAAFLLLGGTAVRINLWQAARDPELAHLRRMGRLGGPYTFLYLGVPGYLAMALLSYLHLTPLWLECAVTVTTPFAAVLVTILFMREWRKAVIKAPGG
jgi:hypothetical protein